MDQTVRIGQRFNGPPNSGNGGYSCGILAAYIDGPATVRLYTPPPLDQDFTVTAQGDSVSMSLDDTLVGKAVPSDLQLEVPAAPTLEQAHEASQRFPCYREHAYPGCFVCGPERKQHDGLCIFPGPIHDWTLLACAWQPASDLLDNAGMVRPEIVWSALDCPGFFAAAGEDLPVTLLGELSARLIRPLPGGEELVVFAWPLGRDGRKRYGATAIANTGGDVLAYSKSTWIELK